MVLMSVDLPKPVWPVNPVSFQFSSWADQPPRRLDNARHSPTQITLNWNPRFNSLRSICDVMLSKPTWLPGVIVDGVAIVVDYERLGETNEGEGCC